MIAINLSGYIMLGCLLASSGLYFYRKKESDEKYKNHVNTLNQ